MFKSIFVSRLQLLSCTVKVRGLQPRVVFEAQYYKQILAWQSAITQVNDV